MPKKKKVIVKKRSTTTKEELLNIQIELFHQLVTLSTSAFGLVAALAWNEAIQTFVKTYIEKYFPHGAIWSKFLYAILITALAVFITYNLSKIAAKLSEHRDLKKKS